MLTRLGLELLYLPSHRTLELQTITPLQRENSNKIIYIKVTEVTFATSFGFGGAFRFLGMLGFF